MYCREKASRATFDGTNDHSHRNETSFAVSDSVGRTDFNTKILKSGEKNRLIKLSVTQLEAQVAQAHYESREQHYPT